MRISGLLACSLVVLRLCTGFHFFSEGTKKFAYNPSTGERRLEFSSEGFLRGAVGPFAALYHAQVPTAHDWQTLLAKPRSALEQGDKKVDADASYGPWLEKITSDLKARQAAFVKLRGLNEEQKKRGADAYEFRLEQIRTYLADHADEIADYQHELWRLQNWEESPTANDLPFQELRIAEKRTEIAGGPKVWLAEIGGIEEGYHQDLSRLVTDEQQKAGSDLADRILDAVTDPKAKRLAQMNLVISYGIVGIGVCLMLGLFTRIAAIAGALFLLMVMASQPPWTAGARSDLFFYQLVEAASFVVLCISGAGRWAGLDFLLGSLWNKCCGNQSRPS